MEDLYDDLDTTKSRFRHFEDEVGIMGRLQRHPHMVKIIETFIMKRKFCMIMEPVAETDLRHLLLQIRDGDLRRSDYEPLLIRAFGCLSSGLAFIHEMRIRHKGIYSLLFTRCC